MIVDLVGGDLIIHEVAFHELLIDLDDRFNELLVKLLDLIGSPFSERVGTIHFGESGPRDSRGRLA